ncbi:MAG TPA: alpha/beta hydrolase [Chitinophagales bacterium]|nr:alpha/beta hydrolase [Chitinophagales bacterium]
MFPVEFVVQLRRLFSKENATIEENRKALESAAKILPNFYFNIQHQVVSLDTFEAEWILPKNACNKVLLYLHGGGYSSGSHRTHRPMVSRICKKGGFKGFVINYRKSPENPYPAALEDAHKAYLYLMNEGYTPKNIVIAGDSAGGGLALALLYYLRDHQIDLPKAAALLCPWTDLAITGESVNKNEKFDPYLNRKKIEALRDVYLNGENPLQPYVSPLYGSTIGLPPIYFQAGSNDTIVDDAIRMHEKILKEGGISYLDNYPKMFHVWQAFYIFLSEGRTAIHKISVFLRQELDKE